MMLQRHKFELDNNLKHQEIEFDPKAFLLAPLGKIRLHTFKRWIDNYITILEGFKNFFMILF